MKWLDVVWIVKCICRKTGWDRKRKEKLYLPPMDLPVAVSHVQVSKLLEKSLWSSYKFSITISFTDVGWEEKRENLRLFLENQRMQELDEEEQQQMARWENDQFHPVLMTWCWCWFQGWRQTCWKILGGSGVGKERPWPGRGSHKCLNIWSVIYFVKIYSCHLKIWKENCLKNTNLSVALQSWPCNCSNDKVYTVPPADMLINIAKGLV